MIFNNYLLLECEKRERKRKENNLQKIYDINSKNAKLKLLLNSCKKKLNTVKKMSNKYEQNNKFNISNINMNGDNQSYYGELPMLNSKTLEMLNSM